MGRFFLRFSLLFFFTVVLFSLIWCSKKEGGEGEKNFSVIVKPGTDEQKKVDFSSAFSANIGERLLIEYKGKYSDCPDCSFEWKMGERILSSGRSLPIVFCDVGRKAITFRVISSDGKENEIRELSIDVSATSISRPEDVQRQIDVFKNDILVIGVDRSQTDLAVDKIARAVLTLEKYVRQENSCDSEAVYTLTLGKFSLILSQLQNLVVRYFTGTLSKQDILLIVDGGVKPAKLDLESILNSGALPKDFTFRVKRLQIYVIRDFPETYITEKLVVNLTGEHDTTDFYFFSFLVQAISGVFDIILSYNGSVEFLIRLPELVSGRLQSGRSLSQIILESFIDELISNPAFLGLSVDAYVRLKDAQFSLYNAFKNLQTMFDSLKEETDDQSDDIIRYWDCGKDRVCKGDINEPFADINGNGKYDEDNPSEPFVDLNKNGIWNDAWSSADEGEGDSKYTIGEIIGTDKVQFTGMGDGIYLNFAGQIGGQIYTAIFERKVFNILADNILGGVLDIGKMVGSSNEALRNLACSQGIPFPEVRLWEFFVTPTALRDMLPLWDPNRKTVIIQRDTEPFTDTGLDRKFSWDYPYFHPLTNPDPDKDDVGASSETDGFDTDWDGFCSNQEAYQAWVRKQEGANPVDERDCINVVNNGTEDFDFGVEANLIFDWKDVNRNKVPDIGDIAEPWDDNYGIFNGASGSYSEVKGNNKFDVIDSEHYWPDGRIDPKNTVGPGGMVCATGHYGGDNQDVIDLIYLLLPDPTFSGVMRFYKGETGVIKNKEGEVITENAILHRVIWRAIGLLGILENYPYR